MNILISINNINEGLYITGESIPLFYGNYINLSDKLMNKNLLQYLSDPRIIPNMFNVRAPIIFKHDIDIELRTFKITVDNGDTIIEYDVDNVEQLYKHLEIENSKLTYLYETGPYNARYIQISGFLMMNVFIKVVLS